MIGDERGGYQQELRGALGCVIYRNLAHGDGYRGLPRSSEVEKPMPRDH
jgi:hypothetical protein